MWRRISIKNFRSIERAEVDLAPFTVVVGRNGSGKSNFADAFVLARDIGIDAAAAVARRGGIASVRRWSRTRPYDVDIEVRAATERQDLDGPCDAHHFTIASGGESAEWHFKRETLRARRQAREIERKVATIDIPIMKGTATLPGTTSAMFLARQVGYFGVRNPLMSVRRYRLNPELMRPPQQMTESALLDETGGNITSAVLKMRQMDDHEGVFHDVQLAMQQIVPGLEDIEVRPIGRYLSLVFLQQQGGSTAEFTATEMSDGALRALGIVVAARQMRKDDLLIIEEPEVSIHAGAADLLFHVLKEASKRGNVLLTTHSAELIDAAGDEEILVSAYADGKTRIGPMAEAQRALVREGLFKTAELVRSEPLRIEGDPPAVVDVGQL